ELYEIQERADTNPVWKTIEVVAGDRFSINIGDAYAKDADGNDIADAPRPQGHFYYYRIRSKNGASAWGEWSVPSAPATTSLPEEVITSVSNFPNPVDTRKGGEEAKTNIVYILNQDAEVTITLYDLLGYEVDSWSFGPASEGGKKGANRVQWDGTNGSGQKVAKGGYIAHIKVKSDRGVVTAIRKIGIIH
ncbi:MAG: FlgD immunoglobulin-like domain containing protein, partial [Candidatus Omnitrophota bacterium]